MEVGRLGPSDYFGEWLLADEAFSLSCQFGNTYKNLLAKTISGFILCLLFSIRNINLQEETQKIETLACHIADAATPIGALRKLQQNVFYIAQLQLVAFIRVIVKNITNNIYSKYGRSETENNQKGTK